MSDAKITLALDARGVDAGFNRVEKGMKRMKKSAAGNSMAFLEASRAIEDFSVAGMRGALNNIPGMIMHLGAGAGLAGAATMAAVAMMQLVKVTEAYLDKLRAARELALSKGIGIGSIEGAIEEAEKAIKGAKEESAEALGDHSRRGRQAQVAQETKARLDATQMQLRHEMEIFKLKRAGASLDEIAARKEEQAFEKLQAKRKASQKEFEKGSALKQGFEIEAKAMDLRIRKGEEAKEQLREIQEEEKRRTVNAIKAMKERFGPGPLSEQETIATAAAADDAIKAYKEQTETLRQQLLSEVEAGARAKVRLDLAEKAIAKEDDKLWVLERQLAVERAMEQTEKQRLNIQRAERIAAQGEEEKKKIKESFEKRLSADGVLSDKGARGLAGREAQAAMDSINVQRSMHQELVRIRQNTSKKGKTVGVYAK